ncbi:hypothetical protein QQS21_005466 [Conoideocrella luteorostrata]|uniref:Metalloprotease n=1 Tax=Conoideocrella luteorostrata TaxID=1105319 RepID=A0AAJ0FZ37_9HYPO|nr:hypothetical protein QQS21_005466 [Conoideocrella luteorostrata]
MRLHFLALLASAVALAAADGPVEETKIKHNETRPGRCQFKSAQLEPSAASRTAGKYFSRRQSAGGGATPDDGAIIQMDLYVHVLGRPEENKDNKTQFLLDHKTIENQVKVLNQDFKPVNVSFALKGVDWTIKTDLPKYRYAISYMLDYSSLKDLYKGDKSTLNVYFVNASFQQSGIEGPIAKSGGLYACALNSNTVPGGASPHLNRGHIATHEVGHWLGIDPHSDEGLSTCEKPDDDNPSRECHPSRRCSNYMSYSHDICMNSWEPDQVSFMHNFARELKLGKSPKHWYDAGLSGWPDDFESRQ